MANIVKIREVVIEKQEVVLNKLIELNHNDLIKLMASISALIADIDRAQVEEEMRCNKIIVE